MGMLSSLTSFLLGTATGAGLTYILDPDMGSTRRRQFGDTLRGRVRSAQDEVSGQLDKATDRAMGMVADALPDDPPANEQALVAKVRSEALGDKRWKDYTINVEASGGTVTLRGQVDHAKHRDAIVKAVEGVSGVDEVESLLHLPGEEPANIRSARSASIPRPPTT